MAILRIDFSETSWISLDFDGNLTDLSESDRAFREALITSFLQYGAKRPLSAEQIEAGQRFWQERDQEPQVGIIGPNPCRLCGHFKSYHWNWPEGKIGLDPCTICGCTTYEPSRKRP